MAKSSIVLVVGTKCNDPGQEDEFNRWYENIHIPEVTSTPGFLGATRYKLVEPMEGCPTYLCIYEIEDEAAWQRYGERRRRQQAGEEPPFTYGPAFTVVWRGAFQRLDR